MPRLTGHFFCCVCDNLFRVNKENTFKPEIVKTNLIVILGPTASGKTSLAVRLADDFNGEVISADSRQVYKGMDIGTGKDLSEYHIRDKTIAHHLIDILDPFEEFNVFEYQKRFYAIFSYLLDKNVLPVLVGGSGLYLEAVLMDYKMPYAKPDQCIRQELAVLSVNELQNILLDLNPHLHNKTDLEDKDRLIRKIEIERVRNNPQFNLTQSPAIHAGVFGISWDRSELRRRIAVRLEQRLAEGMIEEVEQLNKQGVSWERLESFGLEYRYIAWYLQNKMSKDDMAGKLQIAIGQFAKRQMTWFRRMEKKGVAIEWINGKDYDLLHSKVLQKLT